MRLTALLALVANLFAPFGIAAGSTNPLGAGLAHLAIALGVITVKVALLGAMLAAGEVFVAKLRLFRVPELLAGSFVLGLMAVTASYFLANQAG
jgi:formate hydrogenlyase subunit 4